MCTIYYVLLYAIFTLVITHVYHLLCASVRILTLVITHAYHLLCVSVRILTLMINYAYCRCLCVLYQPASGHISAALDAGGSIIVCIPAYSSKYYSVIMSSKSNLMINMSAAGAFVCHQPTSGCRQAECFGCWRQHHHSCFWRILWPGSKHGVIHLWFRS